MANIAKILKQKRDAEERLRLNDTTPKIKETVSGETYYSTPTNVQAELVEGKNINITVSLNKWTIEAVMNLLEGTNINITGPDTNGALTIDASIPQATETVLGGIKAKAKTTETSEIAIDETTGKLYGPAPDSAANGIPEGGAAGQILVKKSATNYDTEWKDGYPSGTNLWNRDTSVSGYINATGGITAAAADERSSDYIAINPAKTYQVSTVVTITNSTKQASWAGVGFYDSGKTFISRTAFEESNVIATYVTDKRSYCLVPPSNAAYMRVSARYLEAGLIQVLENSEWKAQIKALGYI